MAEPVDLRLLHVVGSRPQFPKLAAVRRAVRARNKAGGARIDERVVHSGQHYDRELSDIFFEELEIPRPDYNLGVGSGSHAHQTAETVRGVAAVIEQWRPDVTVVYGDTNATLAGALASVQQHVHVAHVEAGVRTRNLFQVEELNRVVADRVARWRYCCTRFNRATLEREGLGEGSLFTGDTVLDNYRHFLPSLDASVLGRLGLEDRGYLLCTVHRAENTDHPQRLSWILEAVVRLQREFRPVVLPLHPRTRKAIEQLGREGQLERSGVRVIEPQGFHAIQALLEHCHCVLSDSGGLQREAYFAGRRCVVPWEYASWPELAQSGWALPGPIEPDPLVERVAAAPPPTRPEQSGLFGDGTAGAQIVEALLSRGGRGES